MRKPALPVVVLLLAAVAPQGSRGQRPFSGAPEIRGALERLNVTGSLLYLAAHPDDENTALLAWAARGRKVRTAYLSLTRGEGGQNLIGAERGDLLGLLRTEELLAARRVDGAEQFFTRAIDFGYSKSAEETIAKWGRERTLADLVWNIRRFRPDVIALRFSATSRDGHGHHTASAMLAAGAFRAAGDAARFPEQLAYVEPWQAKRLVWNSFSFTREQEREAARQPERLVVDTGEFDPVLGMSYGEIAGLARSLHRSQGFGAAERRGPQKQYFTHVAGDPASKDLFDGVDTTWKRVAGAEMAAAALAEAANLFREQDPARSVPALLRARVELAKLKDPIAVRKIREIDEALALCTGLWLDASAAHYRAVPGAKVGVEATAINRSRYPVALVGVSLEGMPGAPGLNIGGKALAYNDPLLWKAEVTVPAGQEPSQPYWLEKAHPNTFYVVEDQKQIGIAAPEPALWARFRLRFGTQVVELERPVIHRYVDRVLGERTRPFVVVPPVVLGMPEAALVFSDAKPRRVDVQVRANAAGAAGKVRLEAPAGWRIVPGAAEFRLAAVDQQQGLTFEVTPPEEEGRGALRAVVEWADAGAAVARSVEAVAYSHIRPQMAFPAAAIDAVRVPVAVAAKSVGYIAGAGDDVPAALRQLGCEVTLLTPEDLRSGGLGRYDAIVTGVRAFNTRADLRANLQRLLDYARDGGTLVVQYNVIEGGFLAGEPRAVDRLGPYPLRIGRDRVAVEEAPVHFVHPDHPLLNRPNRITAKDFDGWVQERGLYFAAQWDPKYTALFRLSDPGEKPLEGATLVARFGKGAYVFTAFSWFRQLPAGVPGAYRIFANLLSAGRTLE